MAINIGATRRVMNLSEATKIRRRKVNSNHLGVVLKIYPTLAYISVDRLGIVQVICYKSCLKNSSLWAYSLTLSFTHSWFPS